jgi:hypothetical protein
MEITSRSYKQLQPEDGAAKKVHIGKPLARARLLGKAMRNRRFNLLVPPAHGADRSFDPSGRERNRLSRSSS